MLDILEIAKKEGLKEGKDQGSLEATREMVVDAMIEKFAVAPPNLAQRIRLIQNSDALKALFRQVFRCENIHDFEMALDRIA